MLLPDWWLVHPGGPEQVAVLAQAPPLRTVVWLDELQRYLDGEYGLTGANTNWPVPQSFLGRLINDSTWAKMPGIVPLLTNHLGDASGAYLAAIALGCVGSNAAPAIPALIQVVDVGAAGSFPNAEAARKYVGEGYSENGWQSVTSMRNTPCVDG